MGKKWMPIAAGILDILSSLYFGLFFGSGWVVLIFFPVPTVIGALATIIAFVGGINALRRKEWPIALAGSFSAVIACFTIVMILYMATPHYSVPTVWFVIGWVTVVVVIPTIILTLLARKHFEGK